MHCYLLFHCLFVGWLVCLLFCALFFFVPLFASLFVHCCPGEVKAGYRMDQKLKLSGTHHIKYLYSIISKSFLIVFSFEVVRLYAQLVLQRSLHQKRKCTPAPFPMGPMFPMGPNVNKCQYASGPKEIMSEMAKLAKNFTRTKIQGM